MKILQPVRGGSVQSSSLPSVDSPLTTPYSDREGQTTSNFFLVVVSHTDEKVQLWQLQEGYQPTTPSSAYKTIKL